MITICYYIAFEEVSFQLLSFNYLFNYFFFGEKPHLVHFIRHPFYKGWPKNTPIFTYFKKLYKPRR